MTVYANCYDATTVKAYEESFWRIILVYSQQMTKCTTYKLQMGS
jgi:hypothetical protein